MHRGVDKGDDRHVETLSHLHQAQRFTIAFRRWHTKVAANFLFGFTTFLVADDHHRTPVQTRDTADDSFIVSISAVASQFVKFVKRQADIIQGVRTLWMARQLGNLPCTEIGKDFARQLYAFSRRRCTSSSMLISSFHPDGLPQSENRFSLPALQSAVQNQGNSDS
jgi:hypothetical protein